MSLSSILLTSGLSTIDFSNVNDCLNQLITAIKNQLTTDGTLFATIYDNVATASPTVERVVVLQIGDCPHYLQFRPATTKTNVYMYILNLNPASYPSTLYLQTGNYVVNGLICRLMTGPSSFLLKMSADGINSVPWMATKATNGLWYITSLSTSMVNHSDNALLSLSSPYYPNIVDNSGNNQIIPTMMYVSSIATIQQLQNMYGLLLPASSNYYFFTDATGSIYYYGLTYMFKMI